MGFIGQVGAWERTANRHDQIEVSIEEAEEMIQNQIIHDAKTIYAVQYMQLKLAKKEQKDFRSSCHLGYWHILKNKKQSNTILLK